MVGILGGERLEMEDDDGWPPVKDSPVELVPLGVANEESVILRGFRDTFGRS